MKRVPAIWFGILLLIAVYVVAARFTELQEIAALFKQAQPAWVAVAIVLQIGTYLAAGRAYHDILRVFEYHIRFGVLTKLYLAMIFLTHVLPVGGFSGTLYLTAVLKRLGVGEGHGAGVSLLGLFTGYLAFVILVILSVVVLLIRGALGDIPLTTIGIVFAIIILFFVLIDRIVAHREKFCHLLEHIFEVIGVKNRWAARLDRFETFMEDLGEARSLFLASKRKFIAPTLYQLAILLLDAITILAVFFAFGERAPFAVILVAYALARFFGAISFLPGGVGSFEAAQILTMKALGVPLATATVVTLFFRLFSFWLPTPIGLYFYRHLQKDKSVIQ